MAHAGDLNQYIDERLRDYRPDRYQAGDEFLDRVADSIPDTFYDVDDLLSRVKQADVKRRETKARRNANQLLREFHSTGQLELHWRTTANEPLSVTAYTVDDDGNRMKSTEYVTLRAATADDLMAWADYEESKAQEDYEARMAAVEGARQIAASIVDRKAHMFMAWADEIDPEAGAA